jgi:choline dehydrogenase-like flavoprotein
MQQLRGRILGGSSSINGSLFIRGLPEDYARWGSSRWTFEEVLPYFRALETDVDFTTELHGQDGPIIVSRSLDRPLTARQTAVYAAARAAGAADKADLNDPSGDGIGRVPMATRSRSTALTYLAAARGRANLRVVSGCRARRLVFDGTSAVGVEVESADGEGTVVRGHELVLSAGTFGSAQLLLASGIGPADQLAAHGIQCVADRSGVGQNLRCHPMVTLHAPGMSAAEPDPETPRLVIVQSTTDRNDVMIFPKQWADAFSVMVTLRLPDGVGTLRLQSGDPQRPPAISYGYLEERDLARLQDGLRVAHELLCRLGGGTARPPRPTVDWILDHLETADHACGTCAMGAANDPAAVVDDHCRVYGVDHLRIVDLSIVPQPVRAGPYPTVVMLAERAADLIVGAA